MAKVQAKKCHVSTRGVGSAGDGDDNICTGLHGVCGHGGQMFRRCFAPDTRFSMGLLAEEEVKQTGRWYGYVHHAHGKAADLLRCSRAAAGSVRRTTANVR